MYVQPTTPLSVGGVLDDAIKLYRASFRSCWVVSLIGSILLVLNSIWVLSQAAGFTALTPTEARDPRLALPQLMDLFARMGKVYIVVSLVSLMIFAALFAQMSNIARGRAPQSGAELFGLSLRRLPGLIVGAIVFVFATSIGLLLLLLPGIYLWGKLEFWFAAVFAEDVGGIEGLGRSWNVTVGNWWRSVTIISIALIMILVLELLVSVMSGALIAAPLLISQAEFKSWAILVPVGVRALVSVFVFPTYPAVMLATYHDMKLRREGSDLAARASSLQSA